MVTETENEPETSVEVTIEMDGEERDETNEYDEEEVYEEPQEEVEVFSETLNEDEDDNGELDSLGKLQLRQLKKPPAAKKVISVKVKPPQPSRFRCPIDSADVDKRVRELKEQHRQELERRDELHRNETRRYRADLAHLRSKLDEISAQIRYGQLVTNASYELLANSTTAVNQWVKAVLQTPLYRLWSTWGENRTVGGIELAGGETDFLFPQTGWDILEMLKIPLSIAGVVSWLLAGFDNRLGSYLSKRYHIHSLLPFKARSSLRDLIPISSR
jgi:hypothetical protein